MIGGKQRGSMRTERDCLYARLSVGSRRGEESERLLNVGAGQA